MRKTNVKRGFTLAEMIVVIAIIALLATVVMFNVQEGKKKARDAQRLSDLQQVQLALRVYRDVHGNYPLTGCGAGTGKWASPGPGNQVWYAECSDYIPGLAPNYIAKLPTDPISENTLNSGFFYLSDGVNYKLMVHNTVEKGIINKGTSFARCPATCSQSYCSQPSYAVYSPAYACN